MANEKTRILPTEVIENPDFQSSARNLTTQSVRDKITDKFSESQFETKEEYIAHLIEQHKIRKASNPSDKDKIYLSGCLIIDNTVKSGLDWSDVVADSAIVFDGLISKYQYLPLTKNGVKTSLTTSSLDKFMKHNACEAEKNNGCYYVKGIFRVPDIGVLPDLSPVSADRVLCYHKGKLELEKLPYGREGFFGLPADHIITKSRNCVKIAKAKGFSHETFKALKARQPGVFQKLRSALMPGKDNFSAQ